MEVAVASSVTPGQLDLALLAGDHLYANLIEVIRRVRVRQRWILHETGGSERQERAGQTRTTQGRTARNRAEIRLRLYQHELISSRRAVLIIPARQCDFAGNFAGDVDIAKIDGVVARRIRERKLLAVCARVRKQDLRDARSRGCILRSLPDVYLPLATGHHGDSHVVDPTRAAASHGCRSAGKSDGCGAGSCIDQ